MHFWVLYHLLDIPRKQIISTGRKENRIMEPYMFTEYLFQGKSYSAKLPKLLLCSPIIRLILSNL